MRTLRQRGWAPALTLSVLLAAGPAAAWPIDLRLPISERETRRVELTSLDWAESEDPSVVVARRLPDGALELEAKRAGQSLVLLYAEGGFGVWRVVVGPERTPAPDEATTLAAREACPGMTIGPSNDARRAGALRLEATVADAACRTALLPLLKTDAFLARDLSLTFSAEALQAQLQELQAALSREKLPVKATYVGAGLVLSGAISADAHRQALWIAFHHSAGKVAFEDRIQVAAPVPGVEQEAPVDDRVEVVPPKARSRKTKRAPATPRLQAAPQTPSKGR